MNVQTKKKTNKKLIKFTKSQKSIKKVNGPTKKSLITNLCCNENLYLHLDMILTISMSH